MPGSQSDRRILHYFCVQASADLTGFIKSDFWGRVVLQESQDEPIIRGALIALSSAHLEYTTQEVVANGASAPCESEEVTRQYLRAVRQLRKHLATKARPSKRIVLLCCILFYHFESIRSAYESALEHLRNGLGILHDAEVEAQRADEAEAQGASQASSSTDGGDNFDQLTVMIARMDLQASVNDRVRPPLPMVTAACERIGYSYLAPGDTFRSLEEAQCMLDYLQMQTFRLIKTNLAFNMQPLERIPAYIVKEKQALLEQCHRVPKALLRFMTRYEQEDHRSDVIESTDEQIRNGAMLVQLLCLTIQMFLASNLPADNGIYNGTQNPLTEKILSLAATLLKQNYISSPQTPPEQTLRSYTSNTSVVAPLLFLSTQTSELDTMKQAASLIENTYYRREGLLDGDMAMNTIKQMIWLREQSDSQSPPLAGYFYTPPVTLLSSRCAPM